VLDVGAVTATTMKQSDAQFMAGKSEFACNGATGAVVNEGTIRAALGGYVALLGRGGKQARRWHHGVSPC
jgi:hypothetical protein